MRTNFQGIIPFEEFIATIDSKLHLAPLYQQIAVDPPFHIGYPTWKWDRRFLKAVAARTAIMKSARAADRVALAAS